MARIAFLGLGNMGAGMAARLLDAGHQLSVYNRTASKAAALAASGAALASSPKQTCKGAQAIFCMTADDISSRRLWCDDDGILAADLPAGTFAIECSTLSYDWVKELSTKCSALG